MSENPWYYAQHDRQNGPVSLDALRARAACGDLKPDDLVWSEGLEGWTRAALVHGLLLLPATVPSARRWRFPWKLVTVLTILGLVVAGGLIWRRLASPSIDGLVRIVPADATAFLAIRGLPHLALELRLLGGGEAALLTAVREAVGLAELNDGDQDSVLATGIDVTSPIGMSVQPGSQGTFVYYLPIADRGRLRATLKRFLERKGWTFEEQEIGGRRLVSAKSGAFGAVEHQGYLVAANDEGGESVVPLLEKMIVGQAGSVAQADWFTSMAPFRGGSWHVLALANPAASALASNPWTSNLMGWGARLTIDADAVRLRYQEQSREGLEHELSGLIGAREDRFAGKVAGEAIGALRLSIDLSRLAEAARNWTGELDGLKEAFQLQGENDPMAGLASPLAVAVLKGDAEAEVPLDVVAWVPLKPDHDMQTKHEQLALSLRREGIRVTVVERNGISWYASGDLNLSWAIVDDHLVVAFPNSDRDIVSQSGESYLSSLSRQDVRQDLVSRHDAALHVNLESAIALLRTRSQEGLSGLDQAILDSLGELTCWIDAGPAELVSECSLFARRPGGFAGLAATLGADRSPSTPEVGESR